MLSSRIIWEPKNIDEFLKRENALDLPNIRYNIIEIIDQAYKHDILQDKKCHLTKTFHNELTKQLGPVYPKMCKDIATMAYVRAGKISLKSSEFIKHAADLAVMYIPPQDDAILQRLSKKYNCNSLSEVLVGIAASIESFSLASNLISYKMGSLLPKDSEIVGVLQV